MFSTLQIYKIINELLIYQLAMLLMVLGNVVKCENLHNILVLSIFISGLTVTKLAQLIQHCGLCDVQVAELSIL